VKKRYWMPLVAIVAIPVAAYMALKLPVFGGHPTAEDRLRFASSVAFNESEGVFENRRPELINQMRENSLSFELLQEWFTERQAAKPEEELPQQAPDLPTFLEAADHTKLIWFGHSTFLLNIAGTIVLVDPVFSDTVAPVSFTAKRFQPPVLALNELPKIDVVLISHDHYDHLDQKSIEHFRDAQTLFIAPLGVGTHLTRWGIKADHIIEKDWWETQELNGIEFTAAPSQHFSGRDGINNDETLWASWVIVSAQSRLYYSGDSGYDNHFKEIGEKYGPFDLSIMENGQYDKAWSSVHMFPAETLQAHLDVKAQFLMPVHWGMFELAFHTWYEPVEALSQVAKNENVTLITPVFGQIIVLDSLLKTDHWWKEWL